MASYIDFKKKITPLSEREYQKYILSLPDEERKQHFEIKRSIGLEAPTEDNMLVEAGQAFSQSLVGAGRGLGATFNELGFGSGLQDYFTGVLNRNQQWNAPEDGGVGTYFARALGSGTGSTIGILGVSTIASALGTPAAGITAGVITGFAQSFGDNVQRNRKAGYGEEKAYGMAFLESAIDTTIENAPWGVVGKGAKIIGRLHRISAAGKKELLNKIGQKIAAQVGQKEAQNLLWKWAKQTTMSGLGESGEEGLQFINSYVNQKLGGDPNAEFSIDELADAMAQGFIGGFGMGGVLNLSGVRHDAKMRKLANAPLETASNTETIPGETAVPMAETELIPDETAAVEAPSENIVNPLMDEVIRGVGEEFGVKVDYIDNYTGDKKLESADGFYDPDTDTIYLDRNDVKSDPGLALGHEFKHLLDKQEPELVKAFDDLWKSGQTKEGKAYFQNLMKELKVPENEIPQEIGAEVFGMIFKRPGTMKAYANALNQHTPGMGEKFIQTVVKFFEAIKKRLADIVEADPEAEALFNNVAALEAEAGKILAEVRRRNGTSSQVENVVGAKGNTNVETVPVSQINVDAERFQFKSNTSKASGVDESNKLGGDWDPRTAGNLYLWQDKNGKIYVVNGHHRLELAQRNNVENVNAIIDRESDGVTAEQARRNGVLINIRDGQGEIRDYASFVRSEKLSEDEAKSQGVTARQKGRSGFLLGNAGDTLYDAYRNEVIPENKAVIIAEVAQGNEAIEFAGIKLATDRKLAGETLRQTLKLAAQNTSGTKVDTEQGGLFDMVDDSVLQEWEAIGKIAAKHIKEIRTRIEAAKDAIKNPEAAKSLGVKTTKGAEKLLSQAQQELSRWENYATDSELMAQLRNEAGIAPKEIVPQTESVAEVAPVVSAENAQTTKEGVSEMENTTKEPVVKENLTTEKASKETAPEENAGDEVFFKDRTAELGFSFDEFYKNFKPSLESIIAKARQMFSNTLGSDIEAEWESAANKALVSAYMKYPATGGKAKLKTYASWAVKNAITDINRKHKANFNATGGNISLDQTNEQGEALSEAVADENASAVPEEKNKDLVGDYRKWKSTLNPRDQKILDLSESGKSPSVIARAEGIGMTTEEVKARLKELATAARTEGELQFMRKRGQNIEEVNTKFNDDLDRQIKGELPKGYIHQLGTPGEILLSTGVPDLPIELSSTRLFEKSTQENHPFNIADLKDLPKALQNPVAIFAYGDPKKAQNIIVEIQSDGKNYLVGLLFPSKDNKLTVNFIKGLFPKNTASWLNWIQQGKSLYLNKEKVQSLIAQQRTNLADVSNLDLNSINNIIENFKNASDNLEFMRKRLHKQINPIVVDGKVRDEYADLLGEKGYTPEHIAQWQDKAMDWIIRKGGIVGAVNALFKDQAPSNSAVAEIARRFILNSEVFANDVSYEDRQKLYELEMETRSSWGKAGRAMQLAALSMKDAASVQALLNKLHKDMPPAEVRKLRDDIKKDMGIDIYKLPKEIVDDKSKLDAVLRAHLTHKATFKDKLYEYWINSILSGPSTHASNFLGNTANAVYELGIKRFTEALINTVAGRKDGATFQEFKAMTKAFNWGNAVKAFKQALELEVLDPSGKFLENRTVAIGGKLGRAVRMPGRLLKAADAFAKAIIEPMETAAFACRLGVSDGLSGEDLQSFIQKQLTNPDSKSYQWGRERAKELSFQEDPGYFVNRLMALRESPGFLGTALRIVLPFIKTPTNILRQGARKSILGGIYLGIDTVSRIKNKQGFDGAYVARAAEQLVAWGAFMAFMGLSDDDELPFITGSSAPYGSAEYGFKANKIPPYSIRIGDTWYSYKRIEPLASGLAVIADGIQAWKNARNGKDGMEVIKDIFRSSNQIIVEKSFLDSLGEMQKFVDDPNNFVRAVTNPARGLIPNIYTQIRQSFDENVQDNKSREKGIEWIKDQFVIVTNRVGVTTALPKIDYFGREVKKDDWGDTPFSFLGRLSPVKRVEADSNFDKAERLIWNYNQKNTEAWYPSIPLPGFSRNGQKYYFSGEAYQNFAIDAGKLAHRQINNAIAAGKLNVNNPTESDIKLIKNIFSRARKEIINKHINKAKKQ